MMKNRILTAAVLAPVSLLAMSVPAFAEYSNGRYGTNAQDVRYNEGVIEEAQVLSADPIYRTVRINDPVEQCWDEKVYVSNHNDYQSHTPKILGAIIGAAVGNNFGSGRGRHVATAAGAVLGGSIGRDVQSNKTRGHQSVEYQERCEVVNNYRTEQQIEGYDVTYRYNGQVLSTYTERDPGETIRVSVTVVPVE